MFSRKAHRGGQIKGSKEKTIRVSGSWVGPGVGRGGGEEEEGAGIRSKHAASGVAVTAYGFISGDTHFTTIGSTVHLLGRFGFMYFAI